MANHSVFYKKSGLSFILFLLCSLLCACAATTANNAQQTYLLGQRYYQAQNYGNAFDAINKAAKEGNINAQYALGYMYYYGIGTGVDPHTGISWMQKAASKNQQQAINALAILNKTR